MDQLSLNPIEQGIGKLRVLKRNGTVLNYDDSKIKIAVTKAFLAVEGDQVTSSERVHEMVDKLTSEISVVFERRSHISQTLHIEEIQDQVELALMRAGEHKVARAYVLYREERRKARELLAKEVATKPKIHIIDENNNKIPLDINKLQETVQEACQNLANVEASLIIKETLRNLFDGINFKDVQKALIMSARTLVEQEPNYSFVTAKLLLDELRNEALTFIGLPSKLNQAEMAKLYPNYFVKFIQTGIELNILNDKLADFDLELISNAILAERDLKFTYLSLQTLYDRYFIHKDDIRYELPQAFFMRIAMGLALNEQNKEEKAIEFYKLLSSFNYMSSTPTLFNSGTKHSQLSSCYLSTVPDNLHQIFGAIRDNALLSKFAGGLGNDWTPVRAMGAHIKGTNGKSQGVVPFLNVTNATAVAVNQGGKRKGAVCAYLETWHLDIEEFLELRKNTGDDRRRTHDMNTANWIPDLFMQRVFEDKDWTLFSPDETPELHDLYGKEFAEKYQQYEKMVENGDIRSYKKIKAVSLWRKMLGLLFETGHPWITFKDACNLRSPQQHVGVVHSSNLCTEITLNTSVDEIAVCNLGSINLAQHIKNGKIDDNLLQQTIKTAIRMLDNVIDINYYPVPQAKNSNTKHRPIGLGLMGFQDALYKLNINYSSEEAIKFADESMEKISYYAILASSELAKEKGKYQSYTNSLWDQGILPIDSINLLQQSRGKYLEQDNTAKLNWQKVRDNIKKYGMRNSNVMAIAPTATIANICGVTQSIEPTYQNLYVKSNLSGEFTVINPYLVKDLKQLNIWDQVMINDLKYFNGSLQKINRIPDNLKKRYTTAFEIEPKWLIESASRRQKWLDQAQSLNIYMAEPSGKKLDLLYKMAWLRGLKTTYYLRSLGATNAEKSTVTDGTLNAVSVQACSIDDPDCEACQ